MELLGAQACRPGAWGGEERGGLPLEASLEVNESRSKAVPFGSLLREVHSAINNGFVFTRRLSASHYRSCRSCERILARLRSSSSRSISSSSTISSSNSSSSSGSAEPRAAVRGSRPAPGREQRAAA